MNASRARRRLMRWYRYQSKTNSRRTAKLSGGVHAGESKAYSDAMFAGRAYPRGARAVYYPDWVTY